MTGRPELDEARPIDSPETRSWAHWLTAGLILTVAAAIRVPRLDYSIYVDETWVVDLVQRADLRPHAYHTPPLYYLLLRLWSAAFGFGSEVLRIPSLVLGVLAASVPFLARSLAPKTLSWPAALTWSTLLAFSSPLIFYSSQIKQYTLDALVTALLIALALGAHERSSARLWAAFFALGVAAVCTLYAPVFVVVAVGVAVSPSVVASARRRGGERRHALLLLGGFVCLGLAFVAAYLGFLAPSEETTQRHGDMGDWFGAKGFWLSGSLVHFYGVTRHWAGQALNLTPFFLPFAALAVAVWLLRNQAPARVRFFIAALAGVPVLAIAVASFVGLYPYGETRLMLPVYPGLYLAVAVAVSGLGARTRMRIALPLVAAFWVAAYVFMGTAREPYNSSYMTQYDLRPVFDFVTAHREPDERLFVDPDLRVSLVWEKPELSSAARDWKPGEPVNAGLFLVRGRDAGSLDRRTALELFGVVVVRVPRLGDTKNPAVLSGEGSDAAEDSALGPESGASRP